MGEGVRVLSSKLHPNLGNATALLCTTLHCSKCSARNMRIFVGIDIDPAIREGIERFLEGVRGFAPDARWVRPESLHLTLKFIGEQPEARVEEIKRALAGIKAQPMDITFQGYGFFPTSKSARVFWIGVEAGPELAGLAKAVDEALAALKIPKEDRAFSAHLTLARGGSGSGAPRLKSGDAPNRQFQKLQEKLAAMPSSPEFGTLKFGTMTSREFVLYRSELMRGGSRYTKIGHFPLT